jgi:soluble lytic murein transglycosylase-like protein
MSRGSVTVVFVLALGLASFGPVGGSPVLAPAAAEREDARTGAADPAVQAAAERLAESRVLVPDEVGRLAEVLVQESRRLGLAPSLVLAVIEVESHFDPFAVSSVGAMGLMQVLPSTGEALARDLGIEWRGTRTLFNPVANLRIGLAYLARMRDRFRHLPTALAAYNRGPGAIGRRVRSGAPIPKAYARRVLSAYAETRDRSITSS